MLLNVFSTAFTYSNCIVFDYYILKNDLTNICEEISNIGMKS